MLLFTKYWTLFLKSKSYKRHPIYLGCCIFYNIFNMYKVYIMKDKVNQFGLPYVGQTGLSLKRRAQSHKCREGYSHLPELVVVAEFETRQEALLYEDMLRIKNKWKSESQKASKCILQLDKKNKSIINRFSSLTEAAIKTNSIIAAISMTCNGKRKSHNGYKWAFE